MRKIVLIVFLLAFITLPVLAKESEEYGYAGSGGYGPGEPGYNFPTYDPTAGDPVSIIRGMTEKTAVDLVIPDFIPIRVVRTYKSWDIYENMGYNWRLNYHNRLILNPSKNEIIEITEGNAFQRYIDNLDGSYTSPKGAYSSLTKLSDGSFVIKDKNGLSRHFSKPDYKYVSRLLSISDLNGNVLKLDYDEGSEVLISVTSPSGKKIRFSYDDHRRIIGIEDFTGRKIEYRYSAGGNLIEAQTPGNVITRYEYSGPERPGLLTAEIGPTGNKWQYFYDERGQCVEVKDAMGGSMKLSYDPDKRKTAVTNERGFTTIYEYDADYNITSVTGPAGHSVRKKYDYDRNLLSFTDKDGNQNVFTYDSKGNLPTITNAAGKTAVFTYDPVFSKVTSITDTKGNKTTADYDIKGNLSELKDVLGNITSYRYDDKGELIEYVNAENGKSSFSYYPDGLLESFTDPLGRKSTFTYDLYGNLSSTVDAMGNTTNYVFDESGHLIRVKNAQGNITCYRYDKTGNLLSVEDAKGNITSFEYDGLKRLVKETYPDGSYETYAYDAVSNMVKKVRPDGTPISFKYDGLNRLIEKSLNDKTIRFSYDNAGRLVTVVGPEGTTFFSYDKMGNFLQVIPPGGKKVTYEYDDLGNRTKLIYPDGYSISYEYDALGQLSRISDGSGKVLAVYSYDKIGQRTGLTYGNGITASYKYDASNELLELTNSFKKKFSFCAYSYDKRGNRTLITAPKGSYQYSYDKVSQLTQAVPPNNDTQVFIYDEVGNRKTSKSGNTKLTYISNNLNQYTQINEDSLKYDPNGNLIFYDSWTYAYDSGNKLLSAKSDKTSSTYVYDPFGRRISKTVNGKTTNFLYDGGQVIAEYDGSGVLLHRYVYGPGIDEPICMNVITSSSEAIYYYHYDALGSVVNLTDSNGNIVESYLYDAFGKPNKISSIGNPYYFTGRRLDTETGLYYYRARYYNLLFGKFISPDPIGMIDGPNLYTYVKNNPVNFVDPWGLCVEVGYTPIDPLGLVQHTFIKVIYEGKEYNYGFDAVSGLGLFSFFTGTPVLGHVQKERITGKESYEIIAQGSEIARIVKENIEKSQWGIYHPVYNCYTWRNYILRKSGLHVRY